MSSSRKDNDFNWGDVWRQPPPPGPVPSHQSEKDFNWRQAAPNLPRLDQGQVDHLARQVRIKLAAGKGRREVSIWLQQQGLSPGQADAFLAEFPVAGESDRWERLCTRVSLRLVALLSVAALVLVVVKRPWVEGRWTWRSGTAEIHPWLGFAYFCFSFMAAMTVLWYLSMRFGRFLDTLQDPNAPRGLGIMLVLVCLLTVAALAALFTFG